MAMEEMMKHPAPFLEIRVSDYEAEPWLVAMCAGYENGTWREEQLIEHAMEWLPEFSLKYSEWSSLGVCRTYNILRKEGSITPLLPA